MKRKLTSLLAIFAVAMIGLACFTACQATLAPGGAYAPANTNGVATVQPDMEFYIADAAYQIAWQGMNGIFEFERDNRETLFQLSPSVKHTLDQIRPNAVTANKEYLRAREAYKANPVAAGLTPLQTALAKIQQLFKTAQAAVPQKTA
jgi:hypothetical protein